MTKNKFVTITTTRKIGFLMIFLAVRKQISTDGIIVSIVNLIDKSNEHKHTYFTIGDQLKDFNDIAIQLKPGIQEPVEGNID